MSHDVGYFGPHSVAWRVHADPAMLVAGLRALLLQACHPRAMTAFLAHSGYQEDPWGRLQRTGDYVGTVTFGSRAEADRAAARVRGAHRRIPSMLDPVSGRPYRVDDPDLLRWVHCTEVESFLTTYRRSGGPLAAGDADRYVEEMIVSARLVGLDPATVPADTEQLAGYLHDVRPELAVTPDARQAALLAFVPTMPTWVQLATPARPLWAGVTGLAATLLPAWARRLYGLPGLPTTDVGATVAARALRTAMLAVPAPLREPPHARAARERLAG